MYIHPMWHKGELEYKREENVQDEQEYEITKKINK